jgi:transcriptional repressor NrdR
MVCVYCGGDTQVINSRPQKRINHVWRRRQCTLCDTLFSTSEAPDYSKSLLVGGSSTTKLEPFERDQLFLSLHKSLEHRPTALHDAGGLCATIVVKLRPTVQNGVITRTAIVQTAIVVLHRFDALAAQHYQALHKR